MLSFIFLFMVFLRFMDCFCVLLCCVCVMLVRCWSVFVCMEVSCIVDCLVLMSGKFWWCVFLMVVCCIWLSGILRVVVFMIVIL